MSKEDLYQWSNKLTGNKEYFAENMAMLNEKTYQKQLREDRLTTTDLIQQEHFELTQKQKENEQAKIAARQDAEREKEQAERAEFEDWKRQKEKGLTEKPE